MDFEQTIAKLQAEGNYRTIPTQASERLVDLSNNDYLGLASRDDLSKVFLDRHSRDNHMCLTSSASRLLASRQDSYTRLENRLSDLYKGHSALLFNSGYHANTGIVSAIASMPGTLVVADRLVHASIIDGIVLSRAPFKRFRHNDLNHLKNILAGEQGKWNNILIIAESVYSMDGDKADIDALTEIKTAFPGTMLYIDEAHAVGVLGPGGLGMVMQSSHPDEVDIIIGTFGKALASFGAYAITNATLKNFLINKARSFIFSTSLPPLIADWSLEMLERSLTMDSEREHLKKLGSQLATDLQIGPGSHILPVITGNAALALDISAQLLESGFKVLPIRTPTVPPGTERLRISLSASLDSDTISKFAGTLNRLRK